MRRVNPNINRCTSEYEVNVLLINSYELECYYFYDLSEPLLYVWDVRNSIYNLVGDFFRFCWDANDIKEDLLPDIERLFNTGIGNEVFSSELVSLYAEPEKVYFSDKKNLSNVKNETSVQAFMETESFIEVAKLWYYFLEITKYKIVVKDLPS